jgi:hypothetical protein
MESVRAEKLLDEFGAGPYSAQGRSVARQGALGEECQGSRGEAQEDRQDEGQLMEIHVVRLIGFEWDGLARNHANRFSVSRGGGETPAPQSLDGRGFKRAVSGFGDLNP